MENGLVRSFCFGLLAGLIYWGARKETFGSKGILLLSVYMVSVSLDGLTVHFAIPFVACLLAAVIYGLMAIERQSNVVWIMALLALGQWVGVLVVYAHGNYYVGLLEPLKILSLGVILFALAQTSMFDLYPFRCFVTTTLVIGIIYTNIALAVLSTVGYHPERQTVERLGSEESSQAQLMAWSMVWLFSSVALDFYGLLSNRVSARRLAWVFIVLNVYIKFFEYFWQPSTKPFFFIVVGTALCFVAYQLKLYFFSKKHLKRNI